MGVDVPAPVASVTINGVLGDSIVICLQHSLGRHHGLPVLLETRLSRRAGPLPIQLVVVRFQCCTADLHDAENLGRACVVPCGVGTSAKPEQATRTKYGCEIRYFQICLY